MSTVTIPTTLLAALVDIAAQTPVVQAIIAGQQALQQAQQAAQAAPDPAKAVLDQQGERASVRPD